MRSPSSSSFSLFAVVVHLLIVGLGFGVAIHAVAAEPETSAPPLVVEVTFANGEQIEAQVERRLLDDLATHDLETPDGEPIRIMLADALDDSSAFHVTWVYRADPVLEETFSCSAVELQEQLPEYTLQALRRIRATAATSSVSSPPPTEPIVLSAAAPTTDGWKDTKRFRRSLGIFGTGIVLSLSGGAVVLAGATMAVSRAIARKPPTRLPFVLGAVGAAGVGVGIPLWVVGHRRTSRPAVALRVRPAGAGVSIQGEF